MTCIGISPGFEVVILEQKVEDGVVFVVVDRTVRESIHPAIFPFVRHTT